MSLIGKIILSSSGIKVEGHRGTWYVIEDVLYPVGKLFLLESEQYGDEAACIIVNEDGKIVLEDVWNGFEDYDEYMEGR